MARDKSQAKKPASDPKAIREGIEILKYFEPMLEILVRHDLTDEERGALILKRFPPEVLIPLRDRIDAVRAALPEKKPADAGSGK